MKFSQAKGPALLKLVINNINELKGTWICLSFVCVCVGGGGRGFVTVFLC